MACAAFDAEVLVAGGGPAGLTAARLLALRERQVIVVFPGIPTQRLELIAPAGLPVMKALGLGGFLDDPKIARTCLGIRRRWGTAAWEFDDFLRSPGGHGFVIDRARLEEKLRATAAKAGVAFLQGRVDSVRRKSGGFTAIVRSAGSLVSIRAALVIDATGRCAALGRRLGAKRLPLEHLVAQRIVCTSTDNKLTRPAWLDVETLERSWRYRVMGPDGRLEAWEVIRTAQTKTDTKGCRVDASVAHLSCAADPGWIAVGDAAASFDPITSQGLINAMATSLVAIGAVLGPCGLSEEVCHAYTDAVSATLLHSEKGRNEIYASLARVQRKAAQEAITADGPAKASASLTSPRLSVASPNDP